MADIKIMNRVTRTVSLSDKINTTTSTTSLASGATVILNWDSGDDEWQ